jgi:hypothetical protein
MDYYGFGFIFLLFSILITGFLILKSLRPGVAIPVVIIEYIFWIVYLLSFLYFLFCTLGAEYTEAIDPIDRNYTAFAGKHIATLITYFVLFLGSSLLLHTKGKKLPPLLFILCMIFMLIGIFISIMVITQVIDKQGILYPILNIIMAIKIMVTVITQEITVAPVRQYKNKILHFLNKILSYGSLQPVWVLILLYPVFALVTLILTLFGQESDSLFKAFTETATWNLSEKTHPPYLDHSGHYLCTVAACGHPKIVKPIRIGKRHGREIIVNRQLMIANAYEEMIRDYFPGAHRFIRKMYDRYGYPISKHITNPLRSDCIYLIMKLPEWFFLINLYLFCRNPETKINRQYR